MLITEQKDLNEFCASLKGLEFITIDTEFLREKTYYPKLCLIQIGKPNKEAVAIDPIGGDLDLTPVYDLFFDENLLKVIHAGRQDLEIFFNLAGEIVLPLFDTQIAAMVCGYGDSVGYENLVRTITGGALDKSSQFTNWANRPLSQKQLDYALGDVTHLVDIYLHLKKELDKRGRTNWVFQEEKIMANPETYQNPPENAWKRIKIRTPKPRTLAVLKALAAWRETTAQHRNIPKNWVLRDETLADMAAQAPKDEHHLKKIRNMPSEVAGGDTGKKLIRIIADTIKSDPENWPQPEKRKPLPKNAAGTIDILRMLLKVVCMSEGVATKLVASKDDLETLAMQDKPDIPAMKGWRYDVFGKDALAIKKGDLAIGLKGSKITKYRVSNDTDTH